MQYSAGGRPMGGPNMGGPSMGGPSHSRGGGWMQQNENHMIGDHRAGMGGRSGGGYGGRGGGMGGHRQQQSYFGGRSSRERNNY